MSLLPAQLSPGKPQPEGQSPSKAFQPQPPKAFEKSRAGDGAVRLRWGDLLHGDCTEHAAAGGAGSPQGPRAGVLLCECVIWRRNQRVQMGRRDPG